MEPEILKQIYLLEMRKACAGMEHANQCAARDTARGEWQSNWSEYYHEEEKVFNEAAAKLSAAIQK